MKNTFIFLLTFLFLETQFVYASSLPSGENIISGDISVSSSQNSMTITQSSEQSIIEWTSFDIGAQNTVTFNQPSVNASALNKNLLLRKSSFERASVDAAKECALIVDVGLK